MRHFFILIFILLQFSGSARAACTISQLSDNATTSSFQSLGQSWTATCDGVLSNITVKSDGASTGTLTLYIYNGESVAGGNLIYSQAISSFSGVGLQSINLTGAVNIVNGNQYTFQISSAGGTLKLRYDNTNSYASGKAYSSTAGFVASSDLYFTATISDTTPTASVPSLSEYGMIIMAIILINISMFAIRQRKEV